MPLIAALAAGGVDYAIGVQFGWEWGLAMAIPLGLFFGCIAGKL